MVVVVVVFGWWNISLSPANSTDTKNRDFTIETGDGVREIAKKLHDQGLIRDQIAFFLLVKQLGIEKNVQAGEFNLSPSMSAEQITEELQVGRSDNRMTIKEGWRLENILTYLKEEGFGGDDWTVQEQIPIWKADEGKYFPETYDIPKNWTIDQIREYLVSIYNKKFDSKLQAEAKAKNLTPEQVVTLASIVEKEAGSEADMPIVAGILLNRLNDDHPLQVDATIHYMLGNSKNDWWPKEVLSEDLKIPSPYNTYLNPGLPPGPIGNPSLAAIKSVIYPQKSNYFFYISDKEGNMHYAVTNDQQNANIAKYLQ